MLDLASLTPNTPIHHSLLAHVFHELAKLCFSVEQIVRFILPPPLHTMERLAIETKCDAASYHPLPEVWSSRFRLAYVMWKGRVL